MSPKKVDEKVKMILDKLQDCRTMFHELKGEKTTKQIDFPQDQVDLMNVGICGSFDYLIYNIEQEY